MGFASKHEDDVEAVENVREQQKDVAEKAEAPASDSTEDSDEGSDSDSSDE